MEIDNYGFIAFIKAYAEDSFELRALKCLYNLCGPRGYCYNEGKE
jgi:hypothetical protein